jgi:hypothetical protein
MTNAEIGITGRSPRSFSHSFRAGFAPAGRSNLYQNFTVGAAWLDPGAS